MQTVLKRQEKCKQSNFKIIIIFSNSKYHTLISLSRCLGNKYSVRSKARKTKPVVYARYDGVRAQVTMFQFMLCRINDPCLVGCLPEGLCYSL